MEELEIDEHEVNIADNIPVYLGRTYYKVHMSRSEPNQ
jgi:hypothetical protein